MQEHTKEKIAVYKEYLIRYLSVMCNQKHWDIIAVWEPFAGEGIYGDRKKGSAMVAAETIKQFREKEKEKGILLFLNEQDPIKWHRLKESMEDYSDFVGIFNGDAEIFLDEISKFLSKSRKTHSLIFIDPYGYTQYTKENLDSLFNLDRIDYLIFMPTSHIYRFRSIEGKAARRFALDLGVSENTLSETGYDTFPDELLACLKKIAKSGFGYSYKLENRDASSTHHLFFITKNITGAIKFLEAKNKIKSKLKNNLQLTLFDFDSNKIEGDLFELLREPITNTKLLEEIVKKGYLSKDITPELKKMENEEKLEVSPIPSDLKRRKGSFYLTDKIDKIKICLKHE